ncbi:MAG: YtxH domain-containing protein [Bacteroidota bacterium]
MRSGKVVLGVLAGVAAGAALGILFAPARGSSTRRKISRKSDEYTDEIGEKFNDFIESIKVKFDSVEKVARMMADKGKLKVEEAVEEGRK